VTGQQEERPTLPPEGEAVNMLTGEVRSFLTFQGTSEDAGRISRRLGATLGFQPRTRRLSSPALWGELTLEVGDVLVLTGTGAKPENWRVYGVRAFLQEHRIDPRLDDLRSRVLLASTPSRGGE